MRMRRRTGISAAALWALGVALNTRPSQASQAFIIAGSDVAFATFLSNRQVVLSSASVLQLVDAALAFYGEVEASGIARGPDSDMLLFQWGVYDWGRGPSFEFDITRQFIGAAGSADDAMSQLHLTIRALPTPEMRGLAAGNLWCTNRSGLPDFRRSILSSPAFRLMSEAAPRTASVSWSKV